MIMIGFGFGGVMMGRLMDRFGIFVPLVLGSCGLSLGCFLASRAETLWQFALIHGVLIGFFGSSATFAPLLADISHWFARRRGIAVAICACGNYLAGALWPPLVQHFQTAVGWRTTYVGLSVFTLCTMLPLALVLRRRLRTVVSATARPLAKYSDGVVVRGGDQLLCGDVDAAGSSGRPVQ
jgi:MFS family permease